MNLEERMGGLGGSDMGAILGLNRYRSPLDVWMEKTGRKPGFDGNLQTRFGSYAEEFVAREYCEQTGNRVQRFNAMLRRGVILGHVDRLVIPEGAKRASWRDQVRTDRGLEAKTASAFAAGRDSEWGEAGTDAVVDSYNIQCRVYMALTDCQYWDLAVLFGNQEFRVYHLTRDMELEGYIMEQSERWWRDYVVSDVPPPPISEAEARQRWPRHDPGKLLTASGDLEAVIKAYAGEKARAAEIEKLLQSIKDKLIPALGDAETVASDTGQILATYKANKDGLKIDWQAMAGELTRDYSPEVLATLRQRFTTTTPGARVLRLAKSLEV